MPDHGPKHLTVRRALAEFDTAYGAKRRLLKREQEDFRFALGEQWSAADRAKLEAVGVKPITDNRIQPNLFLLTGLERQNRTDFKAYPEGEEDGLKAEIASALFKDSIKKSGFQYKSSEQFKDGVTCGESHLELYLDFTDSLLNGKPMWRKCDGNMVFPDPASREYDFSDAKYVYKLMLGVSRDDLLAIYGDDPKAKSRIEKSEGGKLDLSHATGGTESHRQPRDYEAGGKSGEDPDSDEATFDLLERYYKKHVKRFFVGDKKTGEIKEAEDRKGAEAFVAEYQAGIEQNAQAYQGAIQQALAAHMSAMPPEALALPQEQHLQMISEAGQLPPPPPEQDPGRFIVIRRSVPEIWCYAVAPGIEEPLADERAWFYPKWRGYGFVPYFARFSTAPLQGDDRHLLIQGVVHGVKGVQEKHNKAEMLMLRHLNSATNSGWLAEEDSWVDPQAVKDFGSTPGINLEHKKGTKEPRQIFPTPLSQGHAALAVESAEAIKAQLGINADLLAAQEGGGDSGRAIALRQKQGLLMIQELFDNLTRSRQIAGRLLLSQLGEMYDTETAIKVLGDAFMVKNFPPMQLMNEQTGQPEPMQDPETGQPMRYDKQMAEVAIAEVLGGKLGEYDVSVGEAVASETQRMAAAAEIMEIAKAGVPVPPDVLVRHAQIPEAAKAEILASIQQAQQLAAAGAPQTRQPASAGGGRR